MNFFTNSSLSALPELAIVLGIMVLVHEFGHFAVAKLCGVRVETFAIGFGKRLFGIVHNNTDYCVNAIPLGGYVKMAGVGDEPISGSEQKVASKDPGELQNHPRWQRTLITLAGPFANFLLAFALVLGLYMSHHEVYDFVVQAPIADYISPASPVAKTGILPGDKVVRFDQTDNPTWQDLEVKSHLALNQTVPFSFLHQGHRVDTSLNVENKGDDRDFFFSQLGFVPVMQPGPIKVAEVSDQTTPAARAGLRAGDIIQSVDGLDLHSVTALQAALLDRAGQPAAVIIQRGQQTLPVTITPYYGDIPRGNKLGKGWLLGFAPSQLPFRVERLPFAAAVAASWQTNLKDSQLIFEVLHRLLTRQVSVKTLSSPIGIGVQVHQAFQLSSKFDWSPVIDLMAAISLNLGIFNLLPIPILDGGMIVFLFIESLIRRDINQQLKERIYQVAFVCLILFAAVVIFNDLTRLIPHAKT